MKKIIFTLIFADLAAGVILFLLGHIMWAFGLGAVSIFLMFGLSQMLSIDNVRYTNQSARKSNRRKSHWR